MPGAATVHRGLWLPRTPSCTEVLSQPGKVSGPGSATPGEGWSCMAMEAAPLKSPAKGKHLLVRLLLPELNGAAAAMAGL